MPIVIMPKQSKMDKMGGGGSDIGRTPPSPSKYAIPGISKNPALKKMKISHSNDAQMTDPKLGNRKSIQMTGKMEDMRDYLDALDGIEEEMTSSDPKMLGKDFFRKINAMGPEDGYEMIRTLLTKDGMEGDIIRDEFNNTAADEGLVPDDDFDEIIDMMLQNFEDMTLEDKSEDNIKESYYKDMMQDVEEGMSKEEFAKKYPGSKDEYDKIKKEIADMSESQVNEGVFKQAQIELQDWAAKYNKTEGTNGDKLADGYFQAMTNTGIVSDAYDADEVMAFNKMKGYPTDEIDSSWEDGDHEDFTTNKSGVSPITAGMFTEINQILSKYNLDVDDASDMYEGKNMENKEIEVEEDCGCEQEAVDQMVTMPMQELADILQLAGYKNYEEKIAEYANEPAENYMDPEEQLIGLSGGLNRPKKSYPASAPGDNPMDQEPREIEETVEQQLYKSYKDFLEAEEIKEKD